MFNDSKYTKWYYNIIDNARNDVSESLYYERHHVIPKSLGGSDNPENIVVLTPKQHYICHAMLTKMVTNTRDIHKMYAAFNMMHVCSNHNRYTSRLYHVLKCKFYKAHSKAMTGRKRSKQSRAKQSANTKGRPWSAARRAAKMEKPTAKPVIASKDNFCQTFESISIAAKELGCDATAIWKVCEGQQSRPAPNGKTYRLKTHHGYSFNYARHPGTFNGSNLDITEIASQG